MLVIIVILKKRPIPDIYEEKSQEPQEEKYPEDVEPQEMKVAEKL